ncbi:ankyrin [Stereum hirsutum FP-91666 SS1]|uniref:ankyrin n=1 Tax=Stereum hirsutum (strain FP-91666) TaxID=721885 RepID=UPI00044103FE|nr:ankyrin [Stereum hirsutum FP-91666 SS1]EIM92840.1 ankyrin [Stereum hirsutum FP-91666 SS1]
MAEDASGASTNERLLAAARTDNEELLLEVFQQEDLDINHQDGLGNTALHIAVSHGSTDVLEHILTHEDCDVDPVNRLDKATPLHLAVQTEDPEMRRYLVESLLEAGANTNVKDKHGDTPMAYLPDDDKEVKALIRKAQAQASVSNDDVANDDDDEPGSGSGSGSDDE